MAKTDVTLSDSQSECSRASDNLYSEKEKMEDETRNSPKTKPPAEFHETFTITKDSNGFGVRVSKEDSRITHIETCSPLLGKAHVGDRIVQVDSTVINKSHELKAAMDKTGKTVRIRIRHGTWSWCVNTCTTMDKIHIEKDKEKVLDPIDVYYIVLHLCSAPEILTPAVSFQVKYDSRERLVVTWVQPGTLAAVHLRPGDIIREVNDHPIASKTMLQYYLAEGIYRKKISLLIESQVGANDQTAADTIEMADDAKAIGIKQAELLRKSQPKPALKSCLAKKTRTAKPMVAIAPVTMNREDSIGTDCDISKLRPVSSSKQGKEKQK